MTEILKKYAPKKSSWHSEFCGKVSYAIVGNYCGISRSRVSHLLNGYDPVPSHIAEKFSELLAELRRAEVKAQKEAK